MPIDLSKIGQTDNKESGVNHSPIIGNDASLAPNPSIVKSTVNNPVRSSIDKNLYDELTELGIFLNDNYTIEELNKNKAKNQSAFTQALHSLAQIGYNEAFLGTLLGFVDLYDAAANKIIQSRAEKNGQEVENDYSSVAAKALTDAQDRARERLAIYRENPDKAFDISDFGWWADNFVNVGSTLSLMIPASVGSKALSLVGKATRLDRGVLAASRMIANAGNRIAKGERLLFRPTAFANEVGAFTKAGTAAFLSRTAENYQEARETRKAVYDKALSDFASLSDAEREDFFKRNPDMIGKSEEDIANHLANIAAGNTFRDDYWMLAMDFLEYRTLGKMLQGNLKGAPTARARIAQRNLTAQLAGKETLEQYSTRNLLKEWGKYTIEHPADILKSIPFNEAVEEGFQGIVQEKSKEYADLFMHPDTSIRTLNSYLQDPHIWEQAFWGVMGGTVFQGVSRAASTAQDAIKHSIEKKKLTDNNQKEFLTQSKRQQIQIEGVKNQLDNFIERIKIIESGKSYSSKDINDANDFTDDTKTERKDIDEETKTAQKEQAINDFIEDIVFDAVDNNTIEILEDLIKNPVIKNYIKENTQGYDAINQQLDDTFDNIFTETEDTYLNIFDTIYSNMSKPSIEGVRLASRIYTHNKLARKHNKLLLDRVNNDLASTQDYGEISRDYESRFLLGLIDSQLNQYDETEQKYQEAYDKGNISIHALKKYKEDIDKSRHTLLTLANDLRTDLESTKNLNKELDKLFSDKGNRSYNKIKNDTESYTAYKSALQALRDSIAEESNNLEDSAISSTTKDLIAKKLIYSLQDYFYAEQELESVDDFRTLYEEVNKTLDALVEKRYRDAVEVLNKYIESQENSDDAVKNIMRNENLPKNVEKAAELLKLGHYSTEDFYRQLIFAKALMDNEKARQRKKEETITNPDGTQEHNPEASAQLTREAQAAEAAQAIANSEDNISQEDDSQVLARQQAAELKKQLDEEETATGINEAIAYGKTYAEEYEYLRNGLLTYWVKNAKSLFNRLQNIKNIDLNDENFRALYNDLKTVFLEKGISQENVHDLIVQNIKMLVNYTKNNSKISTSDKVKFATFAQQIALGIKLPVEGGNMNSITDAVHGPEGFKAFEELLDDLIKSYIELANIYEADGKYYIDLEDIIKTAIENEELTYPDVLNLLNRLSKYTLNNSRFKNYIFKNGSILKQFKDNPLGLIQNIQMKKQVSEEIDTHMHFTTPSKYQDKTKHTPEEYEEYLNALKAVRERKAKTEIVETQNAYAINATFIDTDGETKTVEIGYITAVEMTDPKNKAVRLVTQSRGLIYNLHKENGDIISNFDKLFLSLIEAADRKNKNPNPKAKELLDILINYKEHGGRLGEIITVNEGEDRNSKIKEYYYHIIDLAKFLYGEDLIDYIGKPNNAIDITTLGRNLINDINKVLFFKTEIISPLVMKLYYNQWKERTYENYLRTIEIQNAIDEGKEISVVVQEIGNEVVNYQKSEIPISVNGFKAEENPIVGIIDKTNNIVCEAPGTQFATNPVLRAGTLGMVIRTVNGMPIIAPFTSSNKLFDSEQIGKDVKEELVKLLTDYHKNKSISFDQLKEALAELFGDTKGNFSPIGYGLQVTSNANALRIIYKADNGENKVLAYISKTLPNNNRESRSIILLDANENPIPRKDKKMPSVFSADVVNQLVEEIGKHLVFNKSFFALKHKNESDVNANRYFYKKNGKFYTKFNGNEIAYDSYFDFVMKNNAFNTNVRNENGSYFIQSQSKNSSGQNDLYVDIARIGKPIQSDVNAPGTNLEDALSALKKTESKGIETKRLLDTFNLFGSVRDLLDVLLPNRIYYSNENKENTPDGRFYKTQKGKPKIAITQKGIGKVLTKNRDLLRILTHEGFHYRINELGGIEQYNAVNKLLETYNEFIDYVNKEAELGIDDAIALRDWIKDNNFRPNNEFIKDDKNNIKFAEEWLVESLTRPEITAYLNNHKSNKEVKLNENKSLLQKLIDLILKIFNLENIKKGNILEEQISIFNDTLTENIEPVNIDENGDITLQEPITETPKDDNKQIPLEEGEEGAEDEYELEIDTPDTTNYDSFDLLNESWLSATTSISNNKDIDLVNTAKRAFNSGKSNIAGIALMGNPNEYIKQYPRSIQPLIAKEIADNNIEILCMI